MNKKLRNSLIALAIVAFIGLIIYLAINFMGFWNMWHQPLIKLW